MSGCGLVKLANDETPLYPKSQVLRRGRALFSAEYPWTQFTSRLGATSTSFRSGRLVRVG